MTTKGRTLPERISRWKVMSAALLKMLPEVPHLTDLHTALQKVIDQVEQLDTQAEALRAQSLELTRTKDDLGKTGDDLRNRLGAALKTMHGFDSEKLVEFGLQPRRPRGRDRKPRTRKTPAAQHPEAPPPATGHTTTP